MKRYLYLGVPVGMLVWVAIGQFTVDNLTMVGDLNTAGVLYSQGLQVNSLFQVSGTGDIYNYHSLQGTPASFYQDGHGNIGGAISYDIPGNLTATSFNGSGAGLTSLPPLSTVYPNALTNNDTRSPVILGTVQATGFNGTDNLNNPWVTNTLAGTNPTFFTNTTGRPIWFSIKGTGLIILLTTSSTYPVGPLAIGAGTQLFFPMRTNTVAIITNTTITGNLSFPLN